jgi:hypothetical protein
MAADLKLWYMRDDHSFRPLPHHVESALELIYREFQCGYSHGMLCAHNGRPRRPMIDPDAHGKGDFEEFEPRARRWLTAELSYRSPADLEYASWLPPASVASTAPEAIAIPPDSAPTLEMP